MKTFLYSILFLLVVAASGLVGYSFFRLNDEIAQQSPGTKEVEMQRVPQSEGIKITAPFYIKNASPEYAQLNKAVMQAVTTNASTPILREQYASLYATLVSYSREEQADKKERAYALNLANLLYIINFDAEILRKGINGDRLLAKKFDDYLAAAKKLKMKSGGITSPMFDKGEPSMNYAAQKTVADMDAMSYALYPNSYALLRKNLNTLQADSILQGNFETGKKYTGTEVDKILADNYGPQYINSVYDQVQKFASEGTLYRDTYASSYEIDIMYTSGVLWTKYLAVKSDPEKKDEAIKILKETIPHLNHMVTISDEYNTGRLFYGYIMSAFEKSRIANLGVLDAVTNTQLQREAEKTLAQILSTTRNQQAGAWLRALPKNGWMYLEFQRLAKKQPAIAQYFDSLYAPR